ncbi:zinc finger protein 62 homolog isoform X1 [Leguminivora glycinivorella]|uniref:zinc finger protein 62 homolog isoform X1 n=1 Tax=Leguminivora glycinivorella TaxID=1035111 RepID=UPI00200E5964|nr:zinc finger protein 62 homolog isoform X1 [Leguminivora glycinivorella]XP_047993194.1 zinc finger protein 62 homolog isoform X1 [Leguminivora glycinivorella]
MKPLAKSTPTANETKKKPSHQHLLWQPDKDSLIVPKIIRQYTRKKKADTVESLNNCQLASTTSTNVAATSPEQNNEQTNCTSLVNNHEEIMGRLYDIEIMDVDVKIENHVKTEEKPVSLNEVIQEGVEIKVENIASDVNYNLDQICKKYAKRNNHDKIKENVAIHKETYQINSNNVDTIKVKEEIVDTGSDESIINKYMLESAQTAIKIEPGDDSQYSNIEEHIDGLPSNSLKSENELTTEIKPKAEEMNCNNIIRKKDPRCSEKLRLDQSGLKIVPIQQLQRTFKLPGVQILQNKILITEEIHIKEEAVSDSEDCPEVKDEKKISSSAAKDEIPVIINKIEVKDETAVSSSNIEIKYKIPIARTATEVKKKNPETTSSIGVKNKIEKTASSKTKDIIVSPVDTIQSKSPLPEKIQVRRVMNMPKILKTYGRKQTDPVTMKKCFLLAVSNPLARLLQEEVPPDPRLVCDMCGKNFRGRVGLGMHVRVAHRVARRHACVECGAAFPHHYLLLAHRRAHAAAGAALACALCGRSFRSHYKYAAHLNTHLRERLHPCPVCLQRFPLLSHLSRHADKHTRDDIFSCTHCDETYRLLIHLKRHNEREHEQREEFPCYVCSKILTSNEDFLAHVRTHDNAMHECAFCHKKFTDALQWEAHSAEHVDKISRDRAIDKPYCCEYCKKSFEYKSVLITHIRMHTGERPYECPKCKKKLKTRSALSEHVNSHTRPFPCPVCKRRFGKRDSLSRHMLLHTGERPHACPGCQMTFAQRSSMLQHMRRFHQPGLKRVVKNKRGTRKSNKNKASK